MPFDAPHGVNVAECLALAEFLEGLEPEKYSYENTNQAPCLGGYCGIRLGRDNDCWSASENAKDLLGINKLQATYLTVLVSRTAKTFAGPETNAKMAAAVLRHLAATGEVDWSVAEGVA